MRNHKDEEDSYDQALKSFRKGPSFLSLAASVRARNLLKPVEAAPRPRAAALVSTSSPEAIYQTAMLDIAGAIMGSGAAGTMGGATGGCVIPGPSLLKSSNIVC